MQKKTINFISMFLLSAAVLLMLSSFVFRFIIYPPVDGSLDSDVRPETVEEAIQIDILNGCGVSKLASQSREFMRARGFDVVEIGNNKQEQDLTIVIDRLGDIASAKRVAYAMGINDSLVKTELDSSLYLRATVIIGNDYKSLNPFN